MLSKFAIQMQRLGIDSFDVARRIHSERDGGVEDDTDDGDDKNCDEARPTQFGPKDAPFARGMGIFGHALPDHAARNEYEQVDQQPADHEQGYSCSRQHGGTAWDVAHDASERGLVDPIAAIWSLRRYLRVIHIPPE